MKASRPRVWTALFFLCAAFWLGGALADDAPPPSETPAATAAAEDSDLPIELTQNGILMQVFEQANHAVQTVGDRWQHALQSTLGFRQAKSLWKRYLGTEDARAASFQAIGIIALVLAVAWLLEGLCAWLLRKPRARLIAHAGRRHAEGETASGAHKLHGSDLGLLRRLPDALAYAALDLLPLAGFLLAIMALNALLDGEETGFFRFLEPIVNAYIAVRLTRTALRLLISPVSTGLRLTSVNDGTASYLALWVRRIVILMAAGYALSELATLLGANADLNSTIFKLVGLAVHLMLIVMVLQCRKPVARWMRGASRRGSRRMLAEIWTPVAITLIAGLWLVWALDIVTGFTQLLHYLWRSGLVILAGIVVSVLLLGLLDRLFYGPDYRANALDKNAPRLRYHSLARRIIRVLLRIVIAIVLLQVWGLHALSWFRAGTLSRQIASAFMTIAVVVVLALLAWEAINLAFNNRMQQWSATGGTSRAARLRTLLPILRTTILIVIGLIVLLTALDQLGINIAPLLAGASIIGVALGFGSQKLVQDFITGIFLLMEDAMQVGDQVTLAGITGTVERLSIRTVRLRASDGVLHLIPFSSVGTVSNANRGIGIASVKVVIDTSSDLDLAIATIKQIGAEMRADPTTGPLILNDLELWGVDQVDGSSITLLGQIRSVDSGRMSVQRAFNQRVYLRFRELGIKLARPPAVVAATP